MNTKLVIAVVAALNVGVLAGCSDADTANAQAARVATVVSTPAPTPVYAPEAAPPSVVPAPSPVVVAAPERAQPVPVVARPAPAPKPRYAQVVSVTDAFRTVSEPREVCQDVQVEKQAPVQDEHRIAGTVTGAAVGAVIGNQIGDGKGRKLARVVGIVGGAVAGNQIQKKMQEADTVMETERRCETVTDTREEQVGYDVTYTYAGRTETVRTKTRPGSTLPVRNGEVVIG